MKARSFFLSITILIVLGVSMFAYQAISRTNTRSANIDEVPEVDTTQAPKKAVNVENVVSIELLQENLLGSWSRANGVDNVVCTFEKGTRFYDNQKRTGSFKIGNGNRLYIYYDDGSSEVIYFNNISDDMMQSSSETFIKRPTIYRKQRTAKVEESSQRDPSDLSSAVYTDNPDTTKR